MTDTVTRFEREKASAMDELLGSVKPRARSICSEAKRESESTSLSSQKQTGQKTSLEKTVISLDAEDLAALRRIAFESKMAGDNDNNNVSKIVRRLVHDYVVRSHDA